MAAGRFYGSARGSNRSGTASGGDFGITVGTATTSSIIELAVDQQSGTTSKWDVIDAMERIKEFLLRDTGY